VLTPAGVPAVLVHYPGATYEPEATSAGRYAKTWRMDVYCFASDYRSLLQRVEGLRYRDAGAEQLVAWCVYFMTRALGELGNVRQARPTTEKAWVFAANVVGYVISFSGISSVDVYDDAITLQLERLGICHTPRPIEALFEADNETPQSLDEPVPSPNVADLTED
jgi:hypothetical protein